MKRLAEFFFNPMMYILYSVAGMMFLLAYCHKPVKRYVGTVISVSSWDCSASLKTKTSSGKDTMLFVHARRNECFEAGQVITVWTGGDLTGDFGTTKSMK